MSIAVTTPRDLICCRHLTELTVHRRLDASVPPTNGSGRQQNFLETSRSPVHSDGNKVHLASASHCWLTQVRQITPEWILPLINTCPHHAAFRLAGKFRPHKLTLKAPCLCKTTFHTGQTNDKKANARRTQGSRRNRETLQRYTSKGGCEVVKWRGRAMNTV